MDTEQIEIVSYKRVQILFGISYGTAYRRISECRKALHKEKHQILTMQELKKYFGIV